MKCYQVGGSVRDEIMGVQPHDIDYCVVGSTPEEMIKLGYQQVGKDFPVFLDKDGNEYALARTERKTGDKHTDFEFDFNPEITLKDDCFRRDFTCNAIAKDLESEEIIDYFGGIQDIKNKVLRCVDYETFKLDPLRVLRLCRFSSQLGFSAEIMTLQSCRKMVEDGMLDHLTPERIWKEFEKALHTNHFEYFINNMSYTKALGVVLPEIDSLKTVEEIKEHHPEENTFNHTVLVLEYADKMNYPALVKFALIFHDIGKLLTPKDVLPHHYGHEEAGLEIIDKICDRLRVPNDYRKFAKLSCKYHMNLRRIYEMKPGHIFDMLDDITKGFTQILKLKMLFQVSEADLYGRGKEPREERKNQFDKSQEIAYNMYNILEKVSASDFPELIERSDKLSGKEFGELYRVKKIQYYCDRIKNATEKSV